MPIQTDHEESELLQAFEQGELKSIASKSELAKFKAAARATAHQPQAERRHFALSDAQWDEFQQALERPVQAKPRLQNLLSRPGALGE
jgi:uncharacterized protein (DUF1778 family)